MSLELFSVDAFFDSLSTKIKKTQLPESTEGLSNDASLGKEWQELHQKEESRLNLDGKKDDLKEKTSWALFVKIYTVSITAIIFGVVFVCLFSPFHLSDSVLITLLSTTLVNVLGMCYMGLKYYFRKN